MVTVSPSNKDSKSAKSMPCLLMLVWRLASSHSNFTRLTVVTNCSYVKPAFFRFGECHSLPDAGRWIYSALVVRGGGLADVTVTRKDKDKQRSARNADLGTSGMSD